MVDVGCSPEETLQITNQIIELFDTEIVTVSNLDDLMRFLGSEQKKIDYTVNNCAITKSLDGVRVTFTPGTLVFGIPAIVSSFFGELSTTVFVYLIDEIENFTSNQQLFINSLIRYRRGNTTIKVGARLYGLKTAETLGSGEPIKQDAEFERVELDSILRSWDHRKLARDLIAKRLAKSPYFGEFLDANELEKSFESPDPTDSYRNHAISIVSSWDKRGEDRPYIARLRKRLSEYVTKQDVVNTIIDKLRVPTHPLLEKLNIFQFYRESKSVDEIHTNAERIGNECRNYMLSGAQSAQKYSSTLAHFKSDMLAQLYRDCSQQQVYAGLPTLIHLSQGVPRNLLGILKHIYRRSVFAGEHPFTKGPISIQAQTEGVMDSAAWFWDDAQPDSFGSDVRESLERLARLFQSIRFSDSPSECDLCTFSVDLNTISATSRIVLERAESWSYLIRDRDGSKNKNHFKVDSKYQINPIISPKWRISENKRGNTELRPELCNSMFDKEYRAQYDDLLKRRISAMTFNLNVNKADVAPVKEVLDGQMNLFNEL